MNTMQGSGKYIWADGREYDGAWVNGLQHGIGIYTADGSKRKSLWKEGKRVEYIEEDQ